MTEENLALQKLHPRLELSEISVRFGATQALNKVSFNVRAGEVHALIGENGAGKSTLMKVLSGAHRPDDGKINIDGIECKFQGPQDARLAGVAMIYQELSLAPQLNAVQNIFLGMEPSKAGLLDQSAMRRGAEAALAELEHTVALDTPVHNLSISDKQIIEIARASALGCRILILDEPTSSLTHKDVERLFKLIGRLKRKGHSIIYISHFLEEIQQIADRFTVLRDGQTVGGGETADFGITEIVTLMLGKKLEDLYPRSEHKRGPVIMQVRELSDGGRLEEASFDLYRGEVFGIFGLLGSGRTELLRAIFGLETVRKGEIKVAAAGISGDNAADGISNSSVAAAASVGATGVVWHSFGSGTRFGGTRWAHGLGMLSEDRKSEGLAVEMSIADNLILSDPAPFERNGLLWPKLKLEAGRNWIEKMGIRCEGPSQKASDLSGGNQQKIAIARLLHHGVDVLLLDEPTRGIDLGSKSQIYKLIDGLAAEGKAVLIISSYLPELLGICDRIAVMCRGKLLPASPIEAVSSSSIMIQATTGATEQDVNSA